MIAIFLFACTLLYNNGSSKILTPLLADIFSVEMELHNPVVIEVVLGAEVISLIAVAVVAFVVAISKTSSNFNCNKI